MTAKQRRKEEIQRRESPPYVAWVKLDDRDKSPGRILAILVITVILLYAIGFNSIITEAFMP